MNTTRSQSTTAWLEKARALAPIIEQHRDKGELERRLPTEIHDALREQGFFRLWVPRVYGGDELDLPAFIEVMEELSRWDGAVGWNTLIGSQAPAILINFPKETAERVIAEGKLGAGSTVPSGRAEIIPGGFTVSGRWPLASGCHQAGWLVGTCVVMENGQPAPGENNAPNLRMVLLRVEDCQILDTWYSSGLRGTGSNHFEVNEVFVPAEHSFVFGAPLENPPGALYRGPMPVLLGSPLSAAALGIARDAIESFIAMAGEKTPARGTSKLIERQVNHLRVGQAMALYHSARAFLLDAATRYMGALEEGPVSPTDERTTMLRLAGANAAQASVEAVDLMYTAAGSSAIYAGNRIERCSRDVRMITQHVAVAASNIEAAGASFLGLEGYQQGR